VSRKRAEANKAKNKPQAKVAQVDTAAPAVQVAKADINYDSDASAFISKSIPNISKSVPDIFKSVPGNFIIDSGAIHHMVSSLALLDEVKQTQPTSGKFGDGHQLLSLARGTIFLGPIKLNNVLVVPALKANLLSVSQTHPPFAWRFSRYSVTLCNAEDVSNIEI
jgi:hypothetical protein